MAPSIDASSNILQKIHIFPKCALFCVIFSTFSFAQFANDDIEGVRIKTLSNDPQLSYSDEGEPSKNDVKHGDFYSLSAEDHTGKLISLNKYRNKVTLVVNVASKCGFTDGHYKSLIRMRNLLAINNKFEVLAFPCNQFGAQEPGSNEEIQEFVREVYHVNFPVFGKINVLGDDVPDAFRFLIDSTGVAPTWNFWKYLVDDKGQVVKAWDPRTSVEDIFHEVKEVVDNIGQDQPSYKTRHPRSEGEL